MIESSALDWKGIAEERIYVVQGRHPTVLRAPNRQSYGFNGQSNAHWMHVSKYLLLQILEDDYKYNQQKRGNQVYTMGM